jgi:hypothetical protein
MLQLINFARGGLIADAETARRVAALFLEAHYGKAEVELLRPLVVGMCCKTLVESVCEP